VTPVERI
jgi:hypothetical protein